MNERFNADEFVDGWSETFGKVVGIGAAVIVCAFLAFMAVAMSVAGWHFFVHQLQK